MFVNAGELNKRIAIYRRIDRANERGYLIPEDDQLVHSCWAKFTQQSGTELVQANADFGEERVRFLIRYTAKEIDRKMFVLYAGAVYEITYINDYGDGHRYMEIWCTWKSKEGRP